MEEGLERLGDLPFRELDHAHVDTHRELRCGFPEVVFGQGKTPEELVTISRALVEAHGRVLITRVDADAAGVLGSALPEASHHARARAVTVGLPEPGRGQGNVLVAAAGTSDSAVAEEAELTARFLGARTDLVVDVGVAGLHRLLAQRERLRAADVVVVVAGMEGALPSVVGGLVERPVIAVPTSIGYGASFEGIAPLLTMLNSCAAGVVVVNIDNGFGAGYASAQILRLQTKRQSERTAVRA